MNDDPFDVQALGAVIMSPVGGAFFGSFIKNQHQCRNKGKGKVEPKSSMTRLVDANINRLYLHLADLSMILHMIFG